MKDLKAIDKEMNIVARSILYSVFVISALFLGLFCAKQIRNSSPANNISSNQQPPCPTTQVEFKVFDDSPNEPIFECRSMDDAMAVWTWLSEYPNATKISAYKQKVDGMWIVYAEFEVQNPVDWLAEYENWRTNE